MATAIVAIEFREDGGRYCPACGTEAVASFYGERLANATEAASALDGAGDGGGLVSGYTYDAAVDPTTVQRTDFLSVAASHRTGVGRAARSLRGASPVRSGTGCFSTTMNSAARMARMVRWTGGRVGARPMTRRPLPLELVGLLILGICLLFSVYDWGTAPHRSAFLRWLSAPLWIPAGALLSVLLVIMLTDLLRGEPSLRVSDLRRLWEGAR
jgi:hypothetical protein